ncbi:TIGR04222 domain-containing membrane protein [Xanthomonas sp. NCPPB 2654]|uniref:TIGR04222 domain-containing membrane protein n=1 Tax=unclassified Xanthomonas TaxID=2643310 RepID=UPI0021E05D09|nr:MULTISPECIES: TIGR04222 domain-containing membrane protein [unclassified Xanthomonas]MDL5367573.1 TIGR04222 domain-containing membrane protein [Xanthomonas sp. NCPPB 2654]UYC21243.1 TIGR04222 domain-containing membrane protein [Xanthomonas sp. CFBP 8443]
MTNPTRSILVPDVDAQRALWERLQAYRFGEDDHALPAFVRRVAKDANVSLTLATLAVEEYRRFCFLACVVGEEVTPSALVDQVWHTHLTDTREYWQRFCPQVLLITLHHQPGRGDPAEAERFRAQYRATLAHYWRHFGEPPATCWPPPADVQGAAVRRRLVRWRMPPRVGNALWYWALATLVLAMGLARLHGGVSPLHWPGPSFLLLFLVTIGLVWVLAARLRRAVSEVGEHRAVMQADSAELAYLAGGGERVADMQLALLLACDAVRLQAVRKTRSGGDATLYCTGVDAPAPLQRALSIVRANPQVSLALAALRKEAERLREPLLRKRLLLGRGQAWCARVAGAAPPLALWSVGMLKIQIGLQLQRPVGFLVAAMVLVSMLVLGFLLTPTRRSVAGQRLLAERDAALLTDVGPRQTTQVLDLEQPLALAGTSLLLGTPWADYHTLRTPVANGSGSGCSGSGGGGGDGGGGGSCGGGGCGGCGGGD